MVQAFHKNFNLVKQHSKDYRKLRRYLEGMEHITIVHLPEPVVEVKPSVQPDISERELVFRGELLKLLTGEQDAGFVIIMNRMRIAEPHLVCVLKCLCKMVSCG